MKRFLHYSREKPNSAVEIAKLIVYMTQKQKLYIEVRELERLLFMAQGYHYITNHHFLFSDTMYVHDEELYTPAVRKFYRKFGNSYLKQGTHDVEFNEENPWESKFKRFSVDAYPPEVIQTVDDIVDIVKNSGIPTFVGGFIPTNETVLSPYTIARLLYL